MICVPLHQRMRMLADTGHAHAEALNKCADDLEAALVQLDERETTGKCAMALRTYLRLQHRAKLTWFRATGEQV